LLWRQVTCAELACVREEWPYPTPPGVSDDDAAAVALVGITAHLGLFGRAGLKAGEAVFVNVGAGDVGPWWCRWRRRSAHGALERPDALRALDGPDES
jgi:NADPH:quinone reductase-like Zn-dependent oxidoreductase